MYWTKNMDKSKFNDKKEWRKFGIGLAVILSVIATIQLFTGRDLFFYFYCASGVVLFLSLLIPILIKPVFIAFSYFGFVMSWIMTRLILSLLFYTILTGISVIAKITGNKFLDLKIDKESKSYWIDKTPITRESYENQF